MPEKILPVRAFTRAAERLRARNFGIINFPYLNRRAAQHFSDPTLPRELRLAARDFIKVYNELLAAAEYNPLAYLESQLALARHTIIRLKDKLAHIQPTGVVSRQIRYELIDTPEGEITGSDFIIKTTQGKVRQQQEDFAAYIEKDGRRVFIVADGMGGHGGGSVAARLVVETMQEAILGGQTLLQAAVSSNRAFVDNPKILEQYGKYFIRSGHRGAMGTAVVTAEVDTQAKVLRLLHVGDPRAKFITSTSEGLLTEDMSFIFEYIKNFGISTSLPISDRTLADIERKLADDKLPFSNVITSALGALNAEVGLDAEGRPYLVRNKEGLPKIKTPRIDFIEIPFEESLDPTTLLLYSDGLIRGGGFSESDLTRTVRAATDPVAAGRALIERAHDDSDDNATVALVRLPYRLRLDQLSVINPAVPEVEEALRLPSFSQVEPATVALAPVRLRRTGPADVAANPTLEPPQNPPMPVAPRRKWWQIRKKT